MTSIAVLCPTRDRLTQYTRMLESLVRTSRKGNVVCRSGTNGAKNHYVQNVFPVDTPTVHMWNVLADMQMAQDANTKLFMLGADDMIFSTPLWDEALLEHYDKLENKSHVYALRDSRDENGTPHPIVTREWIKEMGYFMPPAFLHWYVDTVTVNRAKSLNCFTHMKDFLLIHDKPSDRGNADDTHKRIRSMGWHDRDKYVYERYKQ